MDPREGIENRIAAFVAVKPADEKNWAFGGARRESPCPKGIGNEGAGFLPQINSPLDRFEHVLGGYEDALRRSESARLAFRTALDPSPLTAS